MGVRESLLNTITSVADSDFVRIVTSAGASSKATVRNLFKGFESNLSAKSSLTTSDYIRVVGSDNEPYKQSISSMKTAMGVDTLDNRTKVYEYTQLSGSFLDWVQSTFTTNGDYYVVMASSNYEGWAANATGTCRVQKRNADIYLMAFAMYSNTADNNSCYFNRYVGGRWVGWTRMPSRSEVDALNSYKTGSFTASTGSHNLVIRQSGRTVTINGYVNNVALTANTAVEVGTVSGVALPGFSIRGLCGVAAAAYQHPTDVAYVTMDSTGEIYVNSTIVGQRAVYFSLSYTA